MIIDWVAAKAQQFLPAEDDELSVNFDFALSAEIADLLYAQNQAAGQVEAVNTGATLRFALDEHELALA